MQKKKSPTNTADFKYTENTITEDFSLSDRTKPLQLRFDAGIKSEKQAGDRKGDTLHICPVKNRWILPDSTK